MKNLLLTTFLFTTLISLGQITITDNDFPAGGDTVLVSISSDFDLDFETTGPDYTWDYSSLSMDSQRIDTFFDIDDASITYQLIFNNGWFDEDYQADYYQHLFNFAFPETDMIPISNPVGFAKIESDKVEAIGIGLEIGGFEVPIKNEIIDIEYELPLNYGDSWISNSFFEVDLNPAFDGILRRYQERNAQVDGWGQVITPFGTFDVVRTVAVLDFTDSLRIAFGDDGFWIELPTPTQVVYSWWAEDQKIPVLQVVAQDILGSETITSVEYKDRYLGDVSLSENGAIQLQIFPNPTSDYLEIITDFEFDQINIYNASGAITSQFSGDKITDRIDVSTFAAGVYTLEIVSDNRNTTKQFVVK